jgi:hypothetical protein
LVQHCPFPYSTTVRYPPSQRSAPPVRCNLTFSVKVPTPGISTVTKVPYGVPTLGVIPKSFASRVIPALIISCPFGRPTGKKRLRSREVRS